MKKQNALLAALVSCLMVGCEKEPEDRFSKARAFPDSSIAAGLELTPCFYEREGIKYSADCGVLYVPENRQVKTSRLIPLPVRRLLSINPEKKEPVFYLGGGPGLENMRSNVPLSILANHDYIEVGFRGADGVTQMNCDGLGQALVNTETAFSKQAGRSVTKAAVNCLKELKSQNYDLNGYNIVEVVKDMEVAREALGYQEVILQSASYGTRLALLYAHMFPDSIKRSLLIAPNPPGGMVWTAEAVDFKLRQYADHCSKNTYCSSRTSDLSVSIRNAFAQMPSHWLAFSIDPGRVKVAVFNGLYNADMIAPTLDAILDAEDGDYSGLALLSLGYNFMFADALIWGDSLLKAATADYTNKVDLLNFEPEGSTLGSPMMQLGLPFWKSINELGLSRIPKKFQGPLSSDVETLVMVGDIDIATPLEKAKTDIMPYLSNATLVVKKGASHQDRVPGENELRKKFLSTGIVDQSLIENRVVAFEPSIGFSTIAKIALGIAVILPIIIVLIVRVLVRYFKRKAKV